MRFCGLLWVAARRDFPQKPRMHLLVHLHKKRILHRDFARRIGMTPTGFGIALKRGWFRRSAMEQIIRETRGEVMPNDFFDIPALLAAEPERQESADEAA